MANDGEDGNRLRYEFLKKRQDAVFQRFMFGLKIVEILKKMLLQCGLFSRNCFQSFS